MICSLFILMAEKNFLRTIKLHFKKMLHEQEEMETPTHSARENDMSQLGSEHDRCSSGN